MKMKFFVIDESGIQLKEEDFNLETIQKYLGEIPEEIPLPTKTPIIVLLREDCHKLPKNQHAISFFKKIGIKLSMYLNGPVIITGKKDNRYDDIPSNYI